MSGYCPVTVRLLSGYCPVTVRVIVRRCPDGPDTKQPPPSAPRAVCTYTYARLTPRRAKVQGYKTLNSYSFRRPVRSHALAFRLEASCFGSLGPAPPIRARSARSRSFLVSTPRPCSCNTSTDSTVLLLRTCTRPPLTATPSRLEIVGEHRTGRR